ncbi:MAG: TetR/AcrR family transcriptional regulator [Aquisalinus sp.]|nr:TetR/AcrR family transcriptional regulator [Aquisalinus sp.]
MASKSSKSSPRPKTRDRILQTALALFNEEGEAEVSTVEIAAVLDISPGNLYYHFKGKDAIIEGLFDDFEEEIRQVLTAPIAKPLAVEDNWIYLYIIFEEIHDFRFFYNALPTLLDRCPSLQPRFRRLMALKQDVAKAILISLQKAGVLAISQTGVDLLAERIALQITYWIQYCSLKDPNRKEAALIHEGVFSILSQLTPWLGEDGIAYATLLEEFYESRNA